MTSDNFSFYTLEPDRVAPWCVKALIIWNTLHRYYIKAQGGCQVYDDWSPGADKGIIMKENCNNEIIIKLEKKESENMFTQSAEIFNECADEYIKRSGFEKSGVVK